MIKQPATSNARSASTSIIKHPETNIETYKTMGIPLISRDYTNNQMPNPVLATHSY